MITPNMEEPFSSDLSLKSLFEELVAGYGVKTIVETGTYRGATTVALADIADNVVTIEINPAYITREFPKNVRLVVGNSSEKLEEVISEITGPTIYFLDAHWNNYNPLREELVLIAERDPNSIVIVHDFQVPGRPDLGYDIYPDLRIEYTLRYISDIIHKYYNGSSITYNYSAEPGCRGALVLIQEGIHDRYQP